MRLPAARTVTPRAANSPKRSWYELAADQHVSAAADGRAEVAARLTARQIAHAERRAAEWQPKPETCGFNSVGNTALSPGEVRGDDR